MVPKLYYTETSPPIWAVLLTAKALGLKLDLKPVNLFTGEQLKLEFIKINPQHTVPTLEDNGYILWDSHAICAYLASKYGKDDSLYPKDLQKRGTIDQRLHFSSSILQARFAAIVALIIRQRETSIPKEKAESVTQAYDFLEAFLEDKDYLAGDHMTVADLAIVATFSSAVPFIPINKKKHVRLQMWYERMKALPYYLEVEQVGLNRLTVFIKSLLA